MGVGSAQTPCWCHRGVKFRLSSYKYKAVNMSFLRRGNSCVTPDMEIRKRLEVRRYFDKADEDGNGSLTKEEWYNVLNSSGVPTTEAEVEDFFKTMDRDFDQKLTFAEFMGEESHIEKLFKSMDKNNDGFVTKKVVQAKFNLLVKMYFMFLRRTGSLSQRTL